MSDPLDERITLSAEAPHRLRRAEDREEMDIRLRVWEHWLTAFTAVTPHAALMQALDEYHRELGILAVKRLGMTGVKP
jgi:hypothetical protein